MRPRCSRWTFGQAETEWDPKQICDTTLDCMRFRMKSGLRLLDICKLELEKYGTCTYSRTDTSIETRNIISTALGSIVSSMGRFPE